MKIIILGANGMLGSMVQYVGKTRGANIVPLTRKEFDAVKNPICDVGKYFADADAYRVIINCIGAIPQKKPNDDTYFQLNRDFPNQLAAYCKEHSIHLIHISTNCVFSGKAPLMKETDTPDAEDAYGVSKAQGEPDTAVVVRCSIIGFEKDSAAGLLEWCMHMFSENKPMNGYTDHYWNGLTTYELANTIYNIIENKQFSARLEHHYSSNILSKYDILTAISKCIGKDSTIISPTAQGERHYTLYSIYDHTIHKSIESQLEELFEIQDSYRAS